MAKCINDEIEYLESTKTWELVYFYLNNKSISCKWIFNKKLKHGGIIHKYKVRLVGKGFRQI